jgi:dTDP-4-dehydrorhamnose reductase
MRFLLTGRDGQVGSELRRSLAPLGEVTALSRAELDLADAAAIRASVREHRPDWIVNAGAYTAVDKAESEASVAQAVNGEAPALLAEEAARLGARLVHYSTDYVFDGATTRPYREDDPTHPVSAYGRSKLAGERAVMVTGGAHLVLRISWVYAARGRNFLLTMLRLAKERPELRVVCDQYGAPTWSRDIAEATAALIRLQAGRGAAAGPALYHLSAGGRTTWHQFAERIVEEGARRGLCPAVPVRAIATSDFPTPARRPANSVLSNERLTADYGLRLPSWEHSLPRCLDEVAAA